MADALSHGTMPGGTSREIEVEVRAVLERDPHISHPAEIAVSVDEIGTAILRGTVGRRREAHAAKADALGVTGVVEVFNQLEVKLSEPHHRQDAKLRGQALQALMWDADVPAQRIEVEVADGWLTLKGQVSHESHRERALGDVTRLTGLAGITNAIRVAPDPLAWIAGDEADEDAVV